MIVLCPSCVVLPCNQWINLVETSQEISSPTFLQMFLTNSEFWFQWQPKEKKNLFLFQNRVTYFLAVIFYQICSSHVDWSNNGTARGGVVLSYMVIVNTLLLLFWFYLPSPCRIKYLVEHFKNTFLHMYLADF